VHNEAGLGAATLKPERERERRRRRKRRRRGNLQVFQNYAFHPVANFSPAQGLISRRFSKGATDS
jgi:hypothetical protein